MRNYYYNKKMFSIGKGDFVRAYKGRCCFSIGGGACDLFLARLLDAVGHLVRIDRVGPYNLVMVRSGREDQQLRCK